MQKNINILSKRILGIMVICMLYFCAAVQLNPSYNPIALYIIIPLIFAILFLTSKKLFINKSFTILLTLYTWMIITSVQTTFPANTSREIRAIIGCIILSYILSILCAHRGLRPWLYSVYIILFIFTMVYVKNVILPEMVLGKDRIGDENLNANMLAYYVFYMTMSTYIMGETISHSFAKRIVNIFFVILIPITFFVAYITASRQVLIIQTPLFIALLYIRYIRGRTYTALTKIAIALALFTIIPISTNLIDSVYENSQLSERYEMSIKDDGRMVLAKEAIEVGLEHPLVGVGPGNFKEYSSDQLFSHDSFTEIFACCGFIGLFLFLYLIINFLNTQLRRYRETKDKLFLAFIAWGIVFTLAQIFYVYYNRLWLISLFMLIAAHSEYHYNELCSANRLDSEHSTTDSNQSTDNCQ